MNLKRWGLASLAAFAVIFILDFIVHRKLLMPLYQQTSAVWRPQAEACSHCWLMILGNLLTGGVFAWIYTRGYEAGKSGLGQGLRYGFLIGLLISVAYVCVWYVVLPIPFVLAAGWVGSAMADGLIAGAVVGLIYRPA